MVSNKWVGVGYRISKGLLTFKNSLVAFCAPLEKEMT